MDKQGHYPLANALRDLADRHPILGQHDLGPKNAQRLGYRPTAEGIASSTLAIGAVTMGARIGAKN